MSRVENIDEDEEDNENVLSYKVIFLGDTAVGKTSLIFRFCDDRFDEVFTATIGIDIKTKKYIYKDKKIELDIWDSAGQERYKSLAKNSFQGADGIILVYDITDKKTFQNIKIWYKNIKDIIDINKVAIIIVGNKSDLPEKEVNKETCEKFCQQYNLQSIETSCKNNINIQETFNLLIDKMIKIQDELKQQSKRRNSKIDENIFSGKKSSRKKCC